jgi:hypothetical protein
MPSRRSSLVLVAALPVAVLVRAQDAPPLMRQMTGTWEVQQRMWPGPGAKAIDLPAAVAHRQVVEGTCLEEVMEPTSGDSTGAPAFRRHALLNYNAVAKQYEYTSLNAAQQARTLRAPTSGRST